MRNPPDDWFRQIARPTVSNIAERMDELRESTVSLRDPLRNLLWDDPHAKGFWYFVKKFQRYMSDLGVRRHGRRTQLK